MIENEASSQDGSAYRGHDRRLQPLGSAGGDLVAAGALSLAVAWAVALASALIVGRRGIDNAIAIRGVLEAIAATIAAISAVLGALHWRLVGITRSLWSGAAFLVLAGLVLPALAAPSGAGAGSALPGLRLALHLSALVILAAGAARPPVDPAVRPLVIVGFAAVITAVSVSIFQFDADVAGRVSRQPWVVSVAFLAVAGVYALRLRRDRYPVDPWRCLALVGIASSQGAAQLALDGSSTWVIAEGGLLALAMALMCGGKIRALLLAYASQRRELVASALAAEDIDARSRSQRHDVTNALMGLGGAAATLERFHDNLNPEDREELTRGLTREVSRLQAILDQATAEHAPFALADVVPETADLDGGAFSVAPDLVAVGDVEATRSVVHTLLAQAALRAPSDPVGIRAERDGDWVVLRVTDRGPEISRGDRRTLFVRAGTPFSEAARVMRRQGGDLWVEGHGGDRCFALCLPRATKSPSARTG